MRRILTYSFVALAVIAAATIETIAFVTGGSSAPDGARQRPFAFLMLDPKSKEPVRYNPCRPIHYVVNPDHAPQGGVKDIQRAVAMVSDATRLEFDFDGLTDEPANAKRAMYQPGRYGTLKWAPILIAWVPNEQMIRKGRHRAGAGGSVYQVNANGNRVYVSGIVTLNADADLVSGFGAGYTWGDALLHELGHVVGLDHVDDVSQVMYPDITPRAARWGPGDKAGLAKLGRDAGCLDPVTPGTLVQPFGQDDSGRRLNLFLYDLDRGNPDCSLTAFKYLGIGKYHGAYYSDCASWRDEGSYVFFYVRLSSVTDEPARFSLDSLYVVSRDRHAYGTVDVRRAAESPNAFLPPAGTIPAGGSREGLVAFDVPPGFVARFLGYADGNDVLTIRFDGAPRVFRRR